MKQILFFISILVLSFQLLMQDCNSQNLVLKVSGDQSNVFETISTDVYKNQINQNFGSSAALTFFIMQEIEKDADILEVIRGNDRTNRVFSIVAKSELTASEVDAKIIAGINNANSVLQNHMQQNGFSATELADFVKSNLLD